MEIFKIITIQAKDAASTIKEQKSAKYNLKGYFFLVTNMALRMLAYCSFRNPVNYYIVYLSTYYL